jgi:Xaa-Pro aminopeptidase
MSAFQRRADRLAATVEERGLDVLLVTHLLNVRYLTGFTGTSGACLVGPGQRVFVTDFRYVERARHEVPDFDRVQGREDLLESLVELVAGVRSGDGAGPVRLGFDDAHMTVSTHAKLAALAGERITLVPAAGMVEALRAVKDDAEVGAMLAAAEVTTHVYRWLVSDHGLVGHTEHEVALALERRAQDSGADGLSFPAIVAAAENGALPHATPRRHAVIPRDTLVVVDLGCVWESYCSDCTRTFATGEIDQEARDCYELVRSAQEAALAAVRAGADVREVDRAAREPIEQAGRGEQFGHGLGHGVGLEIHEAPRLAPSAAGRLEAGNVVTIEPGVYVPGRFGVRIEDLVLVSAEGPLIMTSLPKELLVVPQ